MNKSGWLRVVLMALALALVIGLAAWGLSAAAAMVRPPTCPPPAMCAP